MFDVHLNFFCSTAGVHGAANQPHCPAAVGLRLPSAGVDELPEEPRAKGTRVGAGPTQRQGGREGDSPSKITTEPKREDGRQGRRRVPLGGDGPTSRRPGRQLQEGRRQLQLRVRSPAVCLPTVRLWRQTVLEAGGQSPEEAGEPVSWPRGHHQGGHVQESRPGRSLQTPRWPRGNCSCGDNTANHRAAWPRRGHILPEGKQEEGWGVLQQVLVQLLHLLFHHGAKRWVLRSVKRLCPPQTLATATKISSRVRTYFCTFSLQEEEEQHLYLDHSREIGIMTVSKKKQFKLYGAEG